MLESTKDGVHIPNIIVDIVEQPLKYNIQEHVGL